MLVANTVENAALAGALRKRMNADTRKVNAGTAVRWLCGSSLLAVGMGVAIGAAAFGYSYLADKRVATETAEHITQVFLGALDNKIIKTVGTVTGTLELADKQLVLKAPPLTIDPRSVVRVDQSAPFRVEGKIETVPRPSPEQLAPDARPPSRARSIVTNYTVFHIVEMGSGHVVSGWKYGDNEQPEPSQQYCYYSQSAGDLEAVVWLGYDGHFKQPKSGRPKLNLRAAYDNCVWR